MLSNKMLKFAHTFRSGIIVLALLSGLMIAGCRGPQKPDPSMTAVRGQGTGTGPGSADWISPEDIARAGALGLETRNPGMLDDGNRLENLFSPIYFEFDQSFIRPADRATLQEAAQYLEANPNAKLLAEGHCDWRGTTEYNMTLGDRRAGSVNAYLEQIGISSDRLETVSKGDLEAITDATDEQMRMDRRADLIIIP
jgi:peptidoglycan-associated lipoprotein